MRDAVQKLEADGVRVTAQKDGLEAELAASRAQSEVWQTLFPYFALKPRLSLSLDTDVDLDVDVVLYPSSAVICSGDGSWSGGTRGERGEAGGGARGRGDRRR